MSRIMPPIPLTGDALARVLLRPRSVALVGASDDAGKTTGRPLHYLRRSGFSGVVYPVNPSRQTVQGEAAWPSLSSLPEVPEHVFVLSSTATVVDTVREAAGLGVPIVTVLASGFSESGPEGIEREKALRQIGLSAGVRLLGPSSLGIVHPSTGLLLTANAAFAEPDLPTGRVFVASQSGSMIGALVSRGKVRGMGFAGLVSVGSEIDLSVGEICAATLDDPAVDGYLLFLESLRNGPQLQAFAREAAHRGKPVIAYKLGRSAAAAEMATTHTGALAGEDDVADAFFKDMGIARVGVLESMLECFPLARRIPLDSPLRGRVGVVTTTGGGAAMVVDQLGIRGVEVEPASQATLAQLRQAGIPANPGRVLDLTLAGTRYEVMKGALDILLKAPEFDLVLSVVGSSARFQPELAVKPLLDSAGSHKPLAVMLVPDAPQALACLTETGIACFRTPEACADSIAAVFARRIPVPALPARAPASGHAAALSEEQAYAVLDQLGIPHMPAVTVSMSAAVLPVLPFAYPVAAKVCSGQIPHKTEVGGVVLDIPDAQGLRMALSALAQNLVQRAPGVVCDEVLVQPMCRGLAEVLVGYRVDREVGPIVMLAAGGVWAEVARDRSIRLAPVSVQTAHAMIDDVRALRVLTGLRGKPQGDLNALAEAIVSLSQLALRPELRVTEAEINPLMVMPAGQGVAAVDALIFQS